MSHNVYGVWRTCVAARVLPMFGGRSSRMRLGLLAAPSTGAAAVFVGPAPWYLGAPHGLGEAYTGIGVVRPKFLCLQQLRDKLRPDVVRSRPIPYVLLVGAVS